MNRADRRALAKAIRSNKPSVKILWPKFPAGLFMGMCFRNRIIDRP